MKISLVVLLMGLVTLEAFGAEVTRRSVSVEGKITNQTIGVSATAHLTLVIVGGKVIATIWTEPPLSGTGQLSGRWMGGWCELNGKLDEGFVLAMRGVMNQRDLRGTYTVEVPGGATQFGKFNFALVPTPPAAAVRSK